MIEGSGSGSVPLTNGSGSRRPKNILIRRIRIRNTAGSSDPDRLDEVIRIVTADLIWLAVCRESSATLRRSWSPPTSWATIVHPSLMPRLVVPVLWTRKFFFRISGSVILIYGHWSGSWRPINCGSGQNRIRILPGHFVGIWKKCCQTGTGRYPI